MKSFNIYAYGVLFGHVRAKNGQDACEIGRKHFDIHFGEEVTAAPVET